tara:strand:- start:888 stop:1247 length:360 start_codon:yes stop_codon:yes gene_type:complete
MRDIMCSGYVAGGNTQFFGTKYKGSAAFPSLDARIRSVTERLSFVDDASGEYESMLAFACPWEANSRRDQVMSLSARLLPWEVSRQDPQKLYFPGENAGWEVYNNKFALSQIHFGEDIR